MNLSPLKDRWKNLFPEVLAFLVIYAFLLRYCTPDLLFSSTTLTGGDTASWLQPLEHLRNVLLPHGRISGWTLSNFFGYNEGQYYFPVPFVTGALLSYLMPVQVALKIVTVAGLFALPAAFYYAARQLFTDRWVRLAAPALSLLFLCNETYTMFGGNFLSTFAGEFCYSWATAFFVFFLGAAWKALAKGANPVPAGVLLALVALCHTFVFLVAFLVPFFFAFHRKPRPESNRIAFRLLTVYGVGLALSAFWLLPMVATRVWASTIPMFWQFTSVVDFLTQTLFPVVALAVGFCLWSLATPGARPLAGFLLFGFGACVFLFVSSSFLEVPDIRFVPPALLLSLLALLLFAQTILDRIATKAEAQKRSGKAKKRSKTKTAGPERPSWVTGPRVIIAVYALCVVGASFQAFNLSSWYRWNYTGYEAKREAGVLTHLTQDFGGDSAAGRFLWEKPDQRDSADFGSERVFENLTHFTGRGTSEGIHYGSSFMARTSTYLQSEYSLNPVDPEADRIYSVVNPEVWALRFRQLNAREIITFSEGIQSRFDAHPDFKKTADYGKFKVYTFQKFPGRYTEVLADDAVSVVKDSTAGFKTDFYRFFRDYELIQHPFVPASFADQALRTRLKGSPYDRYDQLLAQYQNSSAYRDWAPNTGPITSERVEDLTIRFTTTALHQPHLIKVTYSPQFRSVGGEPLYPVSPGFLLIYPDKPEVEIRFETSPWEYAGAVLSLLVLPVGWWLGRKPDRRFPWPRVFQGISMVLFFSGVVLFLVLSLGGTRKVIADYQAAVTQAAIATPLARDQAIARLDPLTTDAMVERYDNLLTANALVLKARLLVGAGRKDLATPLYQQLAFRYRHSRLVDAMRGEIEANR